MNLLPIQYPNVWLEEDREWFTLGELPYQAPAVYYAFIDFKWDGDKVADIIAEAGSDASNKDDGHLVFRTSYQQGSIAEVLRITSGSPVGRVGINQPTPSYTLDIRGEGTNCVKWIRTGSSHAGYLFSDGGGSGIVESDGNLNNTGIYMVPNTRLDLRVGGSERLRIDSSGQMGLGVEPNTNWPSNNDFKALQIGTGACVFGRGSGDEDRGGIAVNWYSDGSNNKYLGNGNAARIYLADGNITFSTAGANSSGANASMTLNDRMTLNSNGKLGIGFNFNYTMNSQSTDLVIGDGGGGRGITLWTAAAADNQTISFQTNESLSRAEGEISYGPTATSTTADRNAMMFRVNSAETVSYTHLTLPTKRIV